MHIPVLTRLSVLRSAYLLFSVQQLPGKTWANALAIVPVLWSFRWDGGAEVWFFNTSAFLFCCWPAQTKVKFWFHHSWEPLTFWFSHRLLDWKHFVFSSPPPGQSHHGFFWNVCQSDHYLSSLILYHWFLSFCYCTVKITYTLEVISSLLGITYSAISIDVNIPRWHAVYWNYWKHKSLAFCLLLEFYYSTVPMMNSNR